MYSWCIIKTRASLVENNTDVLSGIEERRTEMFPVTAVCLLFSTSLQQPLCQHLVLSLTTIRLLYRHSLHLGPTTLSHLRRPVLTAVNLKTFPPPAHSIFTFSPPLFGHIFVLVPQICVPLLSSADVHIYRLSFICFLLFNAYYCFICKCHQPWRLLHFLIDSAVHHHLETSRCLEPEPVQTKP